MKRKRFCISMMLLIICISSNKMAWADEISECEESVKTYDVVADAKQYADGKNVNEFTKKCFEEKKSAIDVGLKNMSYMTEDTTFQSEYCETMDIADAEAFANDKFREYICEQIYYRKSKSEVKSYYLGKPFVAYDVDGTCFAIVYFPVYDGDEAQLVISVNYQEHHWYFEMQTKAAVELLGDMNSDAMAVLINTKFKNKFEDTDVIVYMINNFTYVETPYRCYRFINNAMREKYEDVYSEKEKEFLHLSWKKKKELVEEETKNWKEFDVLEWMRDEDHSRMISTVGGNTYVETVRGLNQDIAGGIICIILIGGAAVIRLVIKRKVV